jgi:crossover junction endodeoxyribonuclease RuvC
MVVRILRLPELPTPADAADALALAITHVWRGSASSRLEAAAAQQRAHLKAAQQKQKMRTR